MSGRVVVAMSGGVDSSLAAALLQEAGYDCIGVTMQIWSPDIPYADADKAGGCCSLSAVDDARRVADQLGIPYYVLSFHELFTREVVDYFAHEYALARTPNPCVRCNQVVKFEALLGKAMELDANWLATGHYARIERGGTSGDKGDGRYMLKRGIDARKDQAYALYMLTQGQLAHTLFPLGGLTKVETRRMAAKRGLGVADKPDSQEICFIPDDDYRRFLSEYAPFALRPGDIVDEDGKVLGRHGGLGLFTIGQRKGLGPALADKMYVKSLDSESNSVVIAPNSGIYGKGLIARDVNIIPWESLPAGTRVQAKVRYSAPMAWATISPVTGGACNGSLLEKVEVVFDEPVRAITPGQSVVFYQEDMVVGGGVISRPI